MTDIINNVAKSNRNLDRLDVLFNGDDTATYTDENGNTRGSLSHQIKDVQASEVQLDDFEQGDWTPTFRVSHAGGNLNTSLGYAKYSRIKDSITLLSRIQYIEFLDYPHSPPDIQIINLQIRGLPFRPALVTSASIYFSQGLSFLEDDVNGSVIPYLDVGPSEYFSIKFISSSGNSVPNFDGYRLADSKVWNLYLNVTYLREPT